MKRLLILFPLMVMALLSNISAGASNATFIPLSVYRFSSGKLLLSGVMLADTANINNGTRGYSDGKAIGLVVLILLAVGVIIALRMRQKEE